MNKIFFFNCIIVIVLCFFVSCCEFLGGNDCNYIDIKCKVTVTFINETKDSIIAWVNFEQYNESNDTFILPNDTLIYVYEINIGKIEGEDDINADNFPIMPHADFKYKDTGNNYLCNYEALENIENYENRKQLEPDEGYLKKVFEFTYKFTEEKKTEAMPCDSLYW